jgi:two-component system sensor histidine kinase UhpB
VLAAGLAAGLGALLLHAETRIRNETEAAMRLARELVETRLPDIRASEDPRAALIQLADDANRLRHVRVELADRQAALTPVDGSGADRPHAPEWFLRHVTPPAPSLRIEAPGDAILVSADPTDETGEVWQEIVWLAIGALAVAMFAFGLVSFAVNRTLRPVTTLSAALLSLERGQLDVRAATSGSPEFALIAARINALATTLQDLDAENHRLIQRIIHVQDDERREIARDLHDEIGSFLFAVRAGVGGLARRLAAPDATPAPLAADCARIEGQIAALQETNRRILGRLRPAALAEMGLIEALRALADGWRQTRPDVEIALACDGTTLAKDEILALTAYRVAQEGLTNAFRHSGASRIVLGVIIDDKFVQIAIEDNGCGLPEPAHRHGYAGLGLRGLAERVAALDGALRVENMPTGGVRLVARIPQKPRPAGIPGALPDRSVEREAST